MANTITIDGNEYDLDSLTECSGHKFLRRPK